MKFSFWKVRAYDFFSMTMAFSLKVEVCFVPIEKSENDVRMHPEIIVDILCSKKYLCEKTAVRQTQSISSVLDNNS